MGAVWQLLANRVHRIEAARLCVVSRSDDVTTYLRDLDIDDRSRSTSVPRFGFLTTRNRDGYQYDKEELTSAHASFQKRAIEWEPVGLADTRCGQGDQRASVATD